MKKAKVSLLALSVLAGGSLATLAAPAPNTGSDYNVFITWTNGTTVPAPVFFIEDAPVPDSNATLSVELLRSSVLNDGSGKIDGAAVYRLTLGGGTNSGGAAADLVCTVTGNITTKGTTPTATVQIKGNGASIDSNGNIGVASMSVKFVGTGSSTTNGDVFTGTFSGTVTPGLKSVNNGKPVKVDPTTTGSAPAFADTVNFSGQVVQANAKLYTMANVGEATEVTGNGSENVKKGTYTVNTKGFGFSKGSSLNLNGTTAIVTNLWIILDQTNLTQATIVIPGKADAKGKIAGQTVKAAGGTVFPFPVGGP
jgi:hypothetical protein